MDFELTDTQRLFQETARHFAEKEIAPIAEKVDELGVFPRDTIRKLGELGFMGIAAPQTYGGAGADTVCYVLALEEISEVPKSVVGVPAVWVNPAVLIVFWPSLKVAVLSAPPTVVSPLAVSDPACAAREAS